MSITTALAARLQAAAEALPAGTSLDDVAAFRDAARAAGIPAPGQWHRIRIRQRFLDLEVDRLLSRP